LSVALVFLKLGTFAFGGPAAHIAMMEDEFVRRRAWLSRAEFLDLLAAANLIPGPSSTELAIFVGLKRAGIPGLIVAGCCFILPAAAIVSTIAAVYVRYGHLPQVMGILTGVKPVIVAIIAQALWGLGRSALKSRFLIGMGVCAFLLAMAGLGPAMILLGSASLSGLLAWRNADNSPETTQRARWSVPLALAGIAALGVGISARQGGSTGDAGKFGLAPLFLFFLKIGAVIFGSGYTLLAFLRTDLVDRFHWLTTSQLLDAIAVGQVTPGPLFTTATFIGYILAGPKGAVIATLGIFLPSFILVAIGAPIIPRLRKSPITSAFLDGAAAAAVALMAAVSLQFAHAALRDIPSLLTLAVSALALFRFRVNSAWLIAGGALASILRTGFQIPHQ
jgi:chromate transporter